MKTLILFFLLIFIVFSVNIVFGQTNEKENKKEMFPVKYVEENGKTTTVNIIQDTTIQLKVNKDMKDYSQKYIPEDQRNNRKKRIPEKIYHINRTTIKED